jgi:hypothetical protein
MNTEQPNFEKLKTVIYQHIAKNPKFEFSLLGGEFKSMYVKRKEALIKVNNLLDNMDIRSIDSVLSNIPNELIPLWYSKKAYIIDYNEKGFLDFILT